MKKNFLFFFFILVISLKAQEKVVIIDSLPKNIEEFEELRDRIAISPEGGAVIFILATQIYTIDREFGKQALTISYDLSELKKGNWYKGYEPSEGNKFFIKQLEKSPYIPFGYIEGAIPENGYKVQLPYKFVFSKIVQEDSQNAKVFIKTYGVMPRPIRLLKNNRGIWKVKEASSIFVSIQPPKQEIKDEL